MSKLLIQESPLTFQPSLAVAIGINEAIVLQQIHYWISNPKNKGYEQDGFKWVYNTYGQWKEENFPFWSENTIQRIFASLEEKGLVISIQPMKSKYDRTKYYRIDYPKLDVFDDTKSEPIDDPKLVCSLNESENTAENTQQKDLVDGILHFQGQIEERKQAHDEFESALGFGSLPWGTGVWERFGKWVQKTYAGDSMAFRKYAEWRKKDGKYQAMSNKQIRLNPEMFIDTGYPAFMAHSSMYGSRESDKEFGLI